MATKPRLTAARRKKIEELIRKTRRTASLCRAEFMLSTARLLDDLADVAKEYMEGLK